MEVDCRDSPQTLKYIHVKNVDTGGKGGGDELGD